MHPDSSPTAQTKFVLYINLWGTTAKLLHEEDGGQLFRRDDVVQCQAHFQETVLNLGQSFAIKATAVEAYVMGDFAYVIGSDLSRLIEFSRQLFTEMSFFKGELRLWPVRAAISHGAVKVSTSVPREQALMPWFGEGLVRAAEIEKSANKGMRLILDRESLSERQYESLNEKFLIRTTAVRGTEHYEINWLASHLNKTVSHDLLVFYESAIRLLMTTGTNYTQQLGSSLRDLITWAQKP